jgi:hypothetical protein
MSTMMITVVRSTASTVSRYSEYSRYSKYSVLFISMRTDTGRDIMTNYELRTPNHELCIVSSRVSSTSEQNSKQYMSTRRFRETRTRSTN